MYPTTHGCQCFEEDIDCITNNPLPNPELCKSQTIPAQGCICTSSYHPDKCICPSNTQDLNGIPSSQCACEANDPRSECAATQCKSQTIPAQGCICTSSYHPDKCICPSN
ncbi:MAG: hypothetical protein EZS28_056409, partial [Streblomastix strix]